MVSSQARLGEWEINTSGYKLGHWARFLTSCADFCRKKRSRNVWKIQKQVLKISWVHYGLIITTRPVEERIVYLEKVTASMCEFSKHKKVFRGVTFTSTSRKRRHVLTITACMVLWCLKEGAVSR
jgi:hypothetical protein